MHIRSPLLACLAVGIVACSDSTAPTTAFSVAVTVESLDGPTFGIAADGAPTIACTASLRAAMVGNGLATWGDAVVRFFSGANRSVPVDTAVIAAATIQSVWGSATIKTGDTQESTLEITGDLPFSGEVAYHYTRQPVGAGTATVSFDCGPTIGSGTALPSITNFTVEPVAGPVQPGDYLTLDYAATSGVGLWQSVIALANPCTARWTFAEQLQHTASRVVRVQVPPTCRLGSLTFTATAVDAAGQQSARSVAPGLTLVDVTRPSISPLFYPPFGGSGTFQIAGDYFVGDALDFLFNASDNYNLRMLTWEIGPVGARDSLPVSGRDTSIAMMIPVQPGWVGPLQLRLFARDSVGLTSDSVVSAPDSIQVYPTITRPTVAATVNGAIWNIAIDQSRGVVYLMQTNDGRIAVFSMTSMTVIDTIGVRGTSDLDLTVSGDTLLLALPLARALGVVDLRQSPLTVSLLPLTVLDTTVDQRPQAVRVASNGKALIAVTGTTARSTSLMEVDLHTGVQRFRPEAGDGVEGLERSQDRTYFVVNDLPGTFQTYDAVADTFGPRVTVPLDGGAANLDATGQHFALGVSIYDRALQFLRRVHTPPIPGGASLPTVFSSDGSILYQGYGFTVMRYRVSDGALLDRSPVPLQVSAGLLRVSPDGTKLIMVQSDCCTTTSRIATMDMP